MKKSIKTATSKHSEFVQRRYLRERLEVVPGLADPRRGLNAEQARQQINTGKSHEIEVHFSQIGDAPPSSSIHPVGTPPGPSVISVQPIDAVLDGYATQRDLLRAKRLAEIDAKTPLAHFDGRAVAEDAAERHLRQVRDAVMADARTLRGIRDGLEEPRPPSPSSNGKTSLAHHQRYAEERNDLDAVLDLEATRLREFRAERIAAANERVSEFTREQLSHVLKQLPAAHRVAVEKAIVGTAGIQENTYLISRPIVAANGQRAVGFSLRNFNAEDGGRPTPELLAREFGLKNAAGIRVASISELMGDARDRLMQIANLGENTCSRLPEHNRPLFVAPADVSPSGRPAGGSDGE